VIAVGVSLLALAALAKLTAGRTVPEFTRLGSLGELGVGGVPVMDVAGGGVLVRREAVRELVRDMECDANRSLVVSRSFSRRSATSFSREDTSTGLQPIETIKKPNSKSRTEHYRMDWSVSLVKRNWTTFWERKEG